MHLSMMLMAVGLAVLIRVCWFRSLESWADRWQRALGAFLLPPVLLLMTSIAVWGMGHHGTMLWHPVGWLGCHIALGILAIAGMSLAYCFGKQWRLLQQVRSLPILAIASRTGRVLETPNLFAAQVGIWQSELVVSRGLLDSLAGDQLEAVLNHEEAHCYYRDTFYFFWLGWIRQLTFWLPRTESLWRELLLLRELRADHWAAQRVEPLTLAEALLLVVQSASAPSNDHYTAFHETASADRLQERIDFLLTQSEIGQRQYQFWIWLLPITLPMLTMPFHS